MGQIPETFMEKNVITIEAMIRRHVDAAKIIACNERSLAVVVLVIMNVRETAQALDTWSRNATLFDKVAADS